MMIKLFCLSAYSRPNLPQFELVSFVDNKQNSTLDRSFPPRRASQFHFADKNTVLNLISVFGAPIKNANINI